mmetsp:Transcript_9389/g.21328  ORF Transcript_9389/g.21328 Transcript_9389/m.21328 type:complete len:662 (-) Transcript_9389:83-2068(-)
MAALATVGCLALLVLAASARRHGVELTDLALQHDDAHAHIKADFDDEEGSPLSAAAALLAAKGGDADAGSFLDLSSEQHRIPFPSGPTCEAPTCSLCSGQTGCSWCPGAAGAPGACKAASECPELTGPATCNIPARQQPSGPEPALWFLTPEEIAAARHGHPWQHTETFTTNNSVQLLQSGADVFRAFHQDVEKAGAGDSVLVSNFAMDLTTPLVAELPDKTLLNHFTEAMSRDARVRVLLRRWGGPASVAEQQRPFLAAIPQASDKPNAAKSQFVNDGRNDVPIGSIHQKYSIIKHSGRLHAMVGGVDFSKNRWDTMAHNEPPEMKSVFRGTKSGWVDRHVRIEGPAAADLANSFADRWNSQVPLRAQSISLSDLMKPMMRFKGGLGEMVEGAEDIDPRPRTAEPYADPKLEPGEGSVAVQMLYTNPPVVMMGDHTRHHFEYAPQGDFTYLEGYLKAIRRAAHHIYIEDQYGMYMPDLYEALAKALERGVRKLVVVYAHTSSVNDVGCAVRRHKMWQPLKDAYPDRVHLLVRKDKVFVHSKMWIVDDMWLAIGSSNIGHRSFTFDPEIGVALVDTETVETPDGIRAKFAVETRAACISELARVPVEQVRALRFPDAFALLWAEGSSLEEVLQVPKLLGSLPEAVYDTMCGKTDEDARTYY